MAMELIQSLTEMRTRVISWGVNAAGAWGQLPCQIRLLIVYKFWEPQTPVALTVCPGL
jgi:hypothetical protein